MLACAADEIYADESSVIGSIGVISAGFGFVDLMEKAGLNAGFTQRVKAKACSTRSVLGKTQDVKRLKSLRGYLWMFTDLVKSRRGESYGR